MQNQAGNVSATSHQPEQHPSNGPNLQYASGAPPPTEDAPDPVSHASSDPQRHIPSATTADSVSSDQLPADVSTEESADDDCAITNVRCYMMTTVLHVLEIRTGEQISQSTIDTLKATISGKPFKAPTPLFNDSAILIISNALYKKFSPWKTRSELVKAVNGVLDNAKTLPGYDDARQCISYAASHLRWKGGRRRLTDREVSFLAMYACELKLQAQGQVSAGLFSQSEVDSIGLQHDEWINQPLSSLSTAACHIAIRFLAGRDEASARDEQEALDYIPKKCATTRRTTSLGRKVQNYFGGSSVWSDNPNVEPDSGRTRNGILFYVNKAVGTLFGRGVCMILVLICTALVCGMAAGMLVGAERWVYIGSSCFMASIMIVTLAFKPLQDDELFYTLSYDEDDKRSDTFAGRFQILWSAVEQSRVLRLVVLFIIFEATVLWTIVVTSYVDAPFISAVRAKSEANAAAKATGTSEATTDTTDDKLEVKSGFTWLVVRACLGGVYALATPIWLVLPRRRISCTQSEMV